MNQGGVSSIEDLVKGIVNEYWHWMSTSGGISDIETKQVLATYLHALFTDPKFVQFLIRKNFR
jgi:hypothetical protein